MLRSKENMLTDISDVTRPLVSVVVTSYNRTQPALDAIKSALAQNFDSFEVIVVEDGSRTDLPEQLERLCGNAVKVLCHVNNLGLAASRNSGAGAAKGDYIAFLDDDDLWDEDKLRLQVDLIRQLPSPAVVFCGARSLNPNGELVALNQPSFEGNIRSALIASKLTTIPSSLVIPTSLFREVGGFDEDLDTGIDHDFWFKLAVFNVDAWPVKNPLVIQTEHQAEQMTSNYPARRLGVEQFLRKWRPQLEKWMGHAEAARYEKHYGTYFLGQSCIVGLLKTGTLIYRFRLLTLFARNPSGFSKHLRFLVALLLGRRIYKFLRKMMAYSIRRSYETAK